VNGSFMPFPLSFFFSFFRHYKQCFKGMRRKVFAIAFGELIKKFDPWSSRLHGHHGYGKSLWKHTMSSPVKSTLLMVCTSV
jgi:hypothetical protein